MRSMVVEWLTFEVPAEERDQWLSVEESVWSRFLETCEGFVRKQMWVEEGEPLRVHAVIWWQSRELWHSITSDVVARVDAEMGPQWKPCTMRVFDVIRQS